MRTKGFTIVEVVVVFLLVLSVTFFVLPKSLNKTKQAKFISKWTEAYSELEYTFSVIKAQKDSEIKKKFEKAQNNNDRKEIILQTIKPYLRITANASPRYKQFYMNNREIEKRGKYYFDNFYLTSSNEIIGIKWIKDNCKGEEVCAVMTIDVNGPEGPNTWGYDIFGVDIFKNTIAPLGKELNPDVLKSDCSKFGLGVFCSNYYLIGGKFD